MYGEEVFPCLLVGALDVTRGGQFSASRALHDYKMVGLSLRKG